jgi:hypothetical protein
MVPVSWTRRHVNGSLPASMPNLGPASRAVFTDGVVDLQIAWQTRLASTRAFDRSVALNFETHARSWA